MAYRIKAGESVEEAVRRITREQIDKAVGEIDDEGMDRHEAVHQARKRCKKVRGLLRLVRPELGDAYANENAWFRDAARPLSDVRDAQSVVEAVDALKEGEDADREALAVVREALVERRRALTDDRQRLEDGLAELRDRLCKARERVDGWTLEDGGFRAVRGGLEKTFGRARDARETALEECTPAALHEWRKRAKYHWYHARLLRNVWREHMEQWAKSAKRLADSLGDDRDLVLLRNVLIADPDAFGGARHVDPVLGLADRRRRELQRKADFAGARLLAESPKRLTKRFGRYWSVWDRER